MKIPPDDQSMTPVNLYEAFSITSQEFPRTYTLLFLRNSRNVVLHTALWCHLLVSSCPHHPMWALLAWSWSVYVPTTLCELCLPGPGKAESGDPSNQQQGRHHQHRNCTVGVHQLAKDYITHDGCNSAYSGEEAKSRRPAKKKMAPASRSDLT